MKPTRCIVAAALLLAACVSVNKSILDRSMMGVPVPRDEVYVYLPGDSLPEYRRIAILNAKGDAEVTDESQMIDKLREEAGKLGANAIILGDTEEPGTGAKIAKALFNTSANRRTQAIAIYVLPVAPTGDATAPTAGRDAPGDSLGGGAILYGDDFALMVTAPEGWVIDSRTGRDLGALAVLYPEDPGWADAPAVIYVSFIDKKGTLDLQAAVRQDLQRTRSESPGVAIERLESIPTQRGDSALVYHTAGDRWGNSDLVAFIDQPNVVIVLAMSANTAEAFQAARPLFEKVVASYMYMGKGPTGGGDERG
jgi:hypothetical protein